MEPLKTHTGKVAPLDRVNVDTDQIIPKQFLKRIERTGFGEFLFWDWAAMKMGRLFRISNSTGRGEGRKRAARSPQFRLRLEPRACPVGAGGLGLPRAHRTQLCRSSTTTVSKTASFPSPSRKKAWMSCFGAPKSMTVTNLPSTWKTAACLTSTDFKLPLKWMNTGVNASSRVWTTSPSPCNWRTKSPPRTPLPRILPPGPGRCGSWGRHKLTLKKDTSCA